MDDPIPGTSRDVASPTAALAGPPTVVRSPTPRRSPLRCPDCHRLFATKISLGVHRRRAHPAATNAEINVERVKHQWSDEELRLMAREEALALALATRRGVRFLNQHLLTVVPGRTLEAIKGMRRFDRYRRLVAAALDVLSEGSSDDSTYLSASSTEIGDGNICSADVDEGRVSSLPASQRSAYNDHRAAIEQLIRSAENIHGWDAPNLIAVARGVLDGAPGDEERIAHWIAVVFPPVLRRPRSLRYRLVNPRRGLRRRIEYAGVQRMYRSNMSRCIKSILDGDNGGDAAVPDVSTMEQHWGPFVSQASHPVPPGPPGRPRQELQHIWRPVSCDEVARVALPLNSAPGLDTVTVRQCLRPSRPYFTTLLW